MAYTSVEEVQALMPKFSLGSGTTPSSPQASSIIGQTAAEIDVALADGDAVVPVTTPAYFLEYLNLVNQYGAVAAILKAMFPASTGAAETPAYAFWEKRYQDALKTFRTGEGIPPDVPAAGAGQLLARSYGTDNPDPQTGEPPAPKFSMNQVF